MSEFKNACRTMLLTPVALGLTLLLLPVLLLTDVPILTHFIEFINHNNR